MKRAAIYARYSTDMQREESIEAQIRACKYFAQKQELEIVHIYADSAKSGRTTKYRDGFNQMISDAESGCFDIVLVHKLNRFSRDGADTLNYKQRLNDAGVELISITERLDNSPEGRLMLFIITGVNEFYSANLAGEVLKGLRENAYQCRHTGGVPPLGYDLGPDKRLVINDHEAEAVRMIFDLYSQGYGYGYIIDQLNQQGYRTKRGQSFGKNSLHDILKNEKYIGYYTFGKTAPANSKGKFNRHQYTDDYIKIDAGCPALVDRETFERVQKMMGDHKKNAQHKAKTVYILSGKLYCGHCNSKMVGENRKSKGTDYYYYVCNRAKRTHTCHKHSVRKDKIEDFVICKLNEIAFSDQYKESIIDAILESYGKESINTEKDRLSDEIQRTETEIQNLIKAIMKGIDGDEIKAALDERKAHKQQLQKKLVALIGAPDCKMDREELTAYIENFLDISKMSPENQRAIIQRYVDRIILYDIHDDDHELGIEIYLNPNQNKFPESLNGCGFEGLSSFSATVSATVCDGFVVIKGALE